MQSGLMVLWNEWLNLLSQRWLKVTCSSVRYFIPLELWHCTVWSRCDELKDAFLKVWTKLIPLNYGWRKENIFKGTMLNIH